MHDVFSVLPPTKKTHDLSDPGEVATPGVLRACQAANCDSERSARVLANSQDAPPDIGNIHRENVRVVEGDQDQEPIREMSDIHSF